MTTAPNTPRRSLRDRLGALLGLPPSINGTIECARCSARYDAVRIPRACFVCRYAFAAEPS